MPPHGVHSQARRDERGTKRRGGGARLRGLWAMPRTAAVVLQERDASTPNLIAVALWNSVASRAEIPFRLEAR